MSQSHKKENKGPVFVQHENPFKGQSREEIDVIFQSAGEKDAGKFLAEFDELRSLLSKVSPIRAEFVVYTNGSVWNVSRRVEHSWIPVIDIPASGAAEGDGSIDDLLLTLQKIEPILHKLDERVEGVEARIFLSGLHIFFGGPNLLTAAADGDLRFGSDCLLRVLSTGADNQHYSWSNMGVVAVRFESFRLRSNIGYPLPQPMEREHIGSYMSQLMGSMAAMVEAASGNVGIDTHLVRLDIALLDYGRRCTQAKGSYPPISPQINEALRGFLAHAFATRFNIRLPSSLDAVLTSDMKHFCRPAWEDLLKDERQEVRETRRAFGAALLSLLMFWRRKK